MTAGSKCNLCGEFYSEGFNYSNLPRAGTKAVISLERKGNLPEPTDENTIAHVCVECEDRFKRTADILGVEVFIDAFLIGAYLEGRKCCECE